MLKGLRYGYGTILATVTEQKIKQKAYGTLPRILLGLCPSTVRHDTPNAWQGKTGIRSKWGERWVLNHSEGIQ